MKEVYDNIGAITLLKDYDIIRTDTCNATLINHIFEVLRASKARKLQFYSVKVPFAIRTERHCSVSKPRKENRHLNLSP